MDDQGVQYTATTVVSVEPSQMVAGRFQGLWDTFKGHLLAGNTSAALAQVGPSLRPRFETVLQQLGADVGDVAAGFGTLRVLDQVGDLAEAVLIQADNGVTALHFIYFRRDSRGRWLIEGM
jgi:hypothetical protein